MKNKYDFFYLRYPPCVAEACRFLKKNLGEFYDFPFIIPFECETIIYEGSDIIIFEKSRYTILTEMTRIIFNSQQKNKRFCWGVINISSEKNTTFFIWVNLKENAEEIIDWFLQNKEFSLKRNDMNEGFTVLWSTQ